MRRSLALEVATFAALAWYAAAHWADGLVAAPAGVRVFGCVAIATAVAVALGLVRDAPGRRLWLLRVTAVGAGIGAGAIAVGLGRRFFAPGRWDELADGLDRGFAGLGSVEWPYAGPEPWTGLTLLLAIPIVLGFAAAFAFWPNRALRPFALVLLVGLYGLAVTEHRFDGELGRGVVLLLLISAWLWLPQLAGRGWRALAMAAAAVGVACVVALPAAAGFDDRKGWVDYESWNPFAEEASSRFDWSHSYGPIDWPRDGSTMMYVRSPKRHYWRLQTLDRFDGRAWVRADDDGQVPILPEPQREEWESRFTVTIADLDTDLFPVAGTMLEITGAEPVAATSDDGTVEAVGESLDEGDSYTVRAYVPDPTPGEMRAAADTVPYGIYFGNTSVFLRGSAAAASPAEIARSPYGRVQRLARRLAADQSSTYDVVRAVQQHLRSRYSYDETPPARRYPLAAFLFRDRIGYCQQFSGAMALMLRTLGIPARVAAGFTPGPYDPKAGEYRVRDLDAHSWVEVWFTGIGWVPFDPTPSVAPADLQSSPEAASASSGAGGAREVPDRPVDALGAETAGGASRPDAGDEGGGGWLLLGALLALSTVVAAAVTLLARRRGRLPARSEEAEVAELRRALARVGEPIPPRLTLRQLEERLDSSDRGAAARYVRMLRTRRYSPRGGRTPGAAARRDLRRALARGRGVRGRLAAFVALPPAAFRRG